MNTYIGLVYTIVYSKLSGICQKEDIEECASDIFIKIDSKTMNLLKNLLKSNNY